MKYISIAIILCAFILFRPYQLQNNGMLYGGDDPEFFSHTTALVFFNYPDYSHEFFKVGGLSPRHGPGPALLTLPFTFFFSLIDRMSCNPIVYSRTAASITGSWTVFGFFLGSIFYFWLTCFLLYKTLLYFVNKHAALLTVIAMLIVQMLPLYIFRRPVFSHQFEIFLQILMIYLLARINNQRFFINKIYLKLIFISIAVGIIPLVRLNNLPALFLWPLCLILFDISISTLKRKIFYLILIYLIAGSLFFHFHYYPKISISEKNLITSIKLNHCSLVPTTSNKNKSIDLSRTSGSIFFKNLKKEIATIVDIFWPKSFSFFIKKIIYIFFGRDWGLIFTAPFLLVGFISFFCFKFKIRKILLIQMIPLLINFFIILKWRTQGGWYGYRYFIFSAIPLFAIPLSLLLQKGLNNNKKLLYTVLTLISMFPFLSMLAFDGNNYSLTLHSAFTPFTSIPVDWVNPNYQIEVWKCLIKTPAGFFIAVGKGGILYVIYLFSLLFGLHHQLPAVIFEKYPDFQFFILLKTIFIYCFPLILYYFYINYDNFKIFILKNLKQLKIKKFIYKE